MAKAKSKKKTLVITIVSVALVICILAALLLTFFFGILKVNKKRAVIIVPGLFASALYDADTGKAVWDPFGELDLWVTDIVRHGDVNMATIGQLIIDDHFQEELAHILANDGMGDGESFLYRFTSVNEDGTSKFNIQPYPPTTESRYKYGLMNAQKEIYDYFEEEYGHSYDVIMFNYDFRMDSRLNGERLETFINENGYEEIILVSHSNGGHVVGSYLARSEENRNKVSLYLSYDAPYLGSVTALTTLENMERMIDGFKDYADMLGIGNKLQTAFETQFLSLGNMSTVYQLLPTYELLCSPHYYYEWNQYLHTPGEEPKLDTSSNARYNWVPFLEIYNYETGELEEKYFYNSVELYEFYCSRPWAHIGNDVNNELRPVMKEWQQYVDSFYCLVDGEYVHVTELVNTYYFCGIGYPTGLTDEYDDSHGNLRCWSDEETDQGDGTVLLYSATANAKDYTRYVVIPYADHYDVVQRFDEFSRETTQRIMDANTDWKHQTLYSLNKRKG